MFLCDAVKQNCSIAFVLALFMSACGPTSTQSESPNSFNDGIPYGIAIPGKKGYVLSPYNNKAVDVKDIPESTLVMDPTFPASEKKYFRVPAGAVEFSQSASSASAGSLANSSYGSSVNSSSSSGNSREGDSQVSNAWSKVPYGSNVNAGSSSGRATNAQGVKMTLPDSFSGYSIDAQYPNWSRWFNINGDSRYQIRFQKCNFKVDFFREYDGFYGYQWASEIRSMTGENFEVWRNCYLADREGSRGKWVMQRVGWALGKNQGAEKSVFNYSQFPDARVDIAKKP